MTGTDQTGSNQSDKTILRQLRELLRRLDVPSEAKARLILLYMLCAKRVSHELRMELCDEARLEQLHLSALQHLNDVHVPVNRVRARELLH